MHEGSTGSAMMFSRLLLPFACSWLTVQATFYWFDPQSPVHMMREIHRDLSRFVLDQLLVALVCVLCSLAGATIASSLGWRSHLARSTVSVLLSLHVAVIYARWAITISYV